MTLIVISLLLLSLLLIVVWLVFPPQRAEQCEGIEALEIEKLQPFHCRHFAQISQLLERSDREFVRRRANPRMRRQWRRERHRILSEYLCGLRQDFFRLHSLARLIAVYSSEVEKKQEWEWLWLGLQFQLLCRLVAVKLWVSKATPVELIRLTELVTGLAARLEHEMSFLVRPAIALPRTHSPF